MPELPEVETVCRTLKRQILNKRILNAKVYWYNIIAYPSVLEFEKQIKNERINDIKRRGKYIMFELDNYYLLSHLRMEGKYFIKDNSSPRLKHEHVIFLLDDNKELRYHDTRKFGKMYLLKKQDVYNVKPLINLGLEPFDTDLTALYLKNTFKKKAIKTELLNQSIIAGIGNIYADEILFKCKINPYTMANSLSDNDYNNIIKYTREIFDKAIKKGGTTIKSYTSSEGIHGLFQTELLVHTKDICSICSKPIIKEMIGGRGTYYCPNCQKR